MPCRGRSSDRPFPSIIRPNIQLFIGIGFAVRPREAADGLQEAMGDTIRNETPTEYFRDLVESAIQRQHLTTREVTAFYLVNLLAGFIHCDRFGSDSEALGVRFVKALGSAGARQRHELRHVGDQSLFISGFFSDSLHRSLVDIDYYIQLGERAYASLARTGDPARGDVFDELAGKFTSFVDVLGDVSERAALTSNTDLLRLYQRWVRSGSRRSADLLAERGIVPIAPVRQRFIQ